MRTVVNSNEVFHLWAHQAQEQARANGARISFDGKDAYSYGAVIGRVVENEKGERAYLISTRQYSVTTSGHQTMLMRAIPHGAVKFGVYNPTANPKENLERMLEEVPALAQAAKRARSHKEWKTNALLFHIKTARKFAAFFSLPVPAFDAIDESDLEKQVEAARAKYQAEVDRQEAQQKENQRLREERAKENLAAWIKGEYSGYVNSHFQYLRVMEGVEGAVKQVETTSGAIVPLSHVKRVAPFILKVLDSGMGFVPLSTVRIGHYTLNSISKDGIVIIGCHRFEESEIRRFYDMIKDIPQEKEDDGFDTEERAMTTGAVDDSP